MIEECKVCGRPANAPHTVWSHGIQTEQCQDECHAPYVQPIISLYTAIVPITEYPFEGHRWLEIHCADYNQYSGQPGALQFMGRVYGRTGWNSDRGVAFYTTRQSVAFGV